MSKNASTNLFAVFCDFSDISSEVVDSSLGEILRTSDSIVNNEGDYFFVLPYTDKYGAEIVKKMFDEFFAKFLNSFVLSYPADGESPQEILGSMQDSVSTFYKKDLHCLDRFTRNY